MQLIGLTGGTGSGKSLVANLLSEYGFAVIDADAVGHAVIAPGGMAEGAVRAAFGDIILRDGIVNRERLAARVFGDAEALRTLNAIVHPAIAVEIANRCMEFAEAGADAVIIDAALLAENGKLEPWLSGLILVLCPVEERVRRLTALRGMQEDDVRRRIAAQSDPEAKRPLAKWIVDNGGTEDELRAQVETIAHAIEAEAQ